MKTRVTLREARPMKTRVTLREVSDKVVSMSWKRIAKYAAVIYVVQALVGVVAGLTIGIMYPEEIMSYIGGLR